MVVDVRAGARSYRARGGDGRSASWSRDGRNDGDGRGLWGLGSRARATSRRDGWRLQVRFPRDASRRGLGDEILSVEGTASRWDCRLGEFHCGTQPCLSVLSQNVLFSDAELIVKAHPFASGQFAVVEHVLHQRVEVRKGTNLRRDVDPLLVGQRLLIFWNEHHTCGHDYFFSVF